MTDDQGYGDLGWHGNPVLDTPNLDSLAAQSVRLDPFYVHPVCTPTRAALMTGRYPYRTRAIDTYRGRAMMEPAERTVAELLHESGYATGIFGKWHLGDCHPMRPQDQGFDRVLVHRGGGIGQASDPPQAPGRYTDPVLLEDGVPVQTEGYCTDVYFGAAMEWIVECVEGGRPFFAYVPTNAPHGPFDDVPEELYTKYRNRDLAAALPPDLRSDPDRHDRLARIFAMIENIDHNVGRLIAKLEALGVGDETLVVYLHDNGPNGNRYRHGQRGTKASVHQGGVRSPLFVRWSARLPSAHRTGHWAAHIDLLPTILEACGVAPPDDLVLDGRSILPLLEGRPGAWPERTLFLQTHRGDVPVAEHHFAAITDRFVLVRASGFGREQPDPNAPFELYDLVADAGEQQDIAAAHPDLVRELLADYRAWFDSVSATRPDNYAPPRIAVGCAAEPVTVLTRQDWRPSPPEPFGRWLVRLAGPGLYEVRCTLQSPAPEGAEAVLALDDEDVRMPLTAGAESVVFPPVWREAGPLALSAWVQAGERRRGVFQATVRKTAATR